MASNFLRTELPIIQAPMAGAQDIQLAIAVAKAGGLGSLPCAMLSLEQIRNEVKTFRAACDKPLNLNFFCHPAPPQPSAKEAVWKKLLEPYYRELKVDPKIKVNSPSRNPFDESLCSLVEELNPEFVSFHFGLPSENLLIRVKKVARVLASATTVTEGQWLQDHGCDAVIAQGLEAGGHRGNFLSDDMSTQMGTFSLVPQLADVLSVPVIASGGISDERGAKAAMILGASAIQVGTSYLFSPEAKISTVHKEKLSEKFAPTALTNIFSGRPARGIVNRLMKDMGPMHSLAPEFPLAGTALVPLKEAASGSQKADFSSLWAGQSASLNRKRSAKEITEALGRAALNFSK